MGVAGYLFGASWDLLHRWIGRAGLFGIALVVALVMLTLARRHWSRLAATVEAWRPAALTYREIALAAGTLGAVALFAKMAEDVIQRESTGFDRAISLAVHQVASPWLDVVMRTFTVIGSAPVVVLVVLALCAWCCYRGDRRAADALAAVALMTETLNLVLKQAFHRARPSLWDVVTLDSYAFPSGHAMAAVAIYGTAAVVAVRLWPSLARVAAIGMPLLALLIGLSRVYLGVHSPTDVLAGFAAGAFVLGGGVYVLYRPTRAG